MTWARRWALSIRCLRCHWMGYNLDVGFRKEGVYVSRCPRCHGVYAAYLWPNAVRTKLTDALPADGKGL